MALTVERMDPGVLDRALNLINGFTGVVSIEVFAFQPLEASMAVLETRLLNP